MNEKDFTESILSLLGNNELGMKIFLEIFSKESAETTESAESK